MREFRLTSPFKFEVKGEGENEEILVNGSISNNIPDLVNDIVTVNCMKDMMNQIEDRNIKVDIEHEAFRGKDNEEKEINKTIVPIARLKDPTITKNGNNHFLNIKSIFNKASKRYKEVKDSIKNKFLDAFSIAFIPEKVKFSKKDGKIFRSLEKIKLLNVALTGNPINTSAQISEIMTKAMNSTKDYVYDDPELKKYLEDKKNNPEIADELEVKNNSKLKACGPFESFDACVLAQKKKGKSEESANKICGAFQEKKSFEEDGKHAHTDLEPLGEHNHPKIEKMVESEINYLDNKINRINEKIGNTQEQEMSNSSSYKDESNTTERRLKEMNTNIEKNTDNVNKEIDEKEKESNNLKSEVKSIRDEMTELKESVNGLAKILEEKFSANSKTNHKAISENQKEENLNGISEEMIKKAGPLGGIR
jgi:hypothetical protein